MKSSRLLPWMALLAGSLLLAREPLLEAVGERRLTLDAAVAIALCQNPLVLNAKAEIERAKGQVIEIRSQALPHVNVSAIYQQQDPNLLKGQAGMAGGQRLGTAPTPTPVRPPALPSPTPIPTPVPTPTVTPTPSPGVIPTPTPIPTPTATPSPSASPLPSPSPQPSATPGFFIQDKTWQVTVQTSQLLYSGGQVRAAIAMARLARDSSYFRLRDAVNTVVATVRSQFYEVLINQALVRVQEESVALLESQLSDQRKRYAAGTVPWFNVLQAEVALANARPSLIQAKNNYHLSQLQLAKTLGYDTHRLPPQREPFCVVGTLDIPAVSMDLACALQTAREHNPSLKAQRQNILIEVQDILVQKAGYKPTLTANAGYIIENNRLSSNLGDVLTGWFFTLQGNWAIFDGLETYGKVKQARARLEQAKVNYEDTVQQVDLQVQQAWANLLQARETILSGRATVEQATEAVRLARERLGAGAGTQLDVLNAAVQLTQAQTTELQARSTYHSALAEFDRVTGIATKYSETFQDPPDCKRPCATPSRPVPHAK